MKNNTTVLATLQRADANSNEVSTVCYYTELAVPTNFQLKLFSLSATHTIMIANCASVIMFEQLLKFE